MELKDLKINTWFSVDAQKYKNSYKLIGKFDNELIECKLNNDSILFFNNTKVTKIEGMKLYLLQGGRDWD